MLTPLAPHSAASAARAPGRSGRVARTRHNMPRWCVRPVTTEVRACFARANLPTGCDQPAEQPLARGVDRQLRVPLDAEHRPRVRPPTRPPRPRRRRPRRSTRQPGRARRPPGGAASSRRRGDRAGRDQGRPGRELDGMADAREHVARPRSVDEVPPNGDGRAPAGRGTRPSSGSAGSPRRPAPARSRRRRVDRSTSIAAQRRRRSSAGSTSPPPVSTSASTSVEQVDGPAGREHHGRPPAAATASTYAPGMPVHGELAVGPRDDVPVPGDPDDRALRSSVTIARRPR